LLLAYLQEQGLTNEKAEELLAELRGRQGRTVGERRARFTPDAHIGRHGKPLAIPFRIAKPSRMVGYSNTELLDDGLDRLFGADRAGFDQCDFRHHRGGQTRP
jgi:hypothetical protein